MNFSETLDLIKEGWFVSRPSWGSAKVGMFKPEWYSTFKHPFIYVETGDDIIPWVPGHDDLFAEDFVKIEFRS